MNNLHIYSAKSQPATDYTDACGEIEIKGGHQPKEMIFCNKCDECWPAAQMVVRCYYDHRTYWCADGHGCNDPDRVSAHRRRSSARRSYAARMAWARRKDREYEEDPS